MLIVELIWFKELAAVCLKMPCRMAFQFLKIMTACIIDPQTQTRNNAQGSFLRRPHKGIQWNKAHTGGAPGKVYGIDGEEICPVSFLHKWSQRQ